MVDVVSDLMHHSTREGEQLRQLYKSIAREQGIDIRPCTDCDSDQFVVAAGTDPVDLHCLFCGKHFTPAKSLADPVGAYGPVMKRSYPAQEIIDQWDREAAVEREARQSRRGLKFGAVR